MPPKGGAKELILVVDDDPKIVALVATYLLRQGYEVISAGDGRSALEAIRSREPGLVVLDLMLPQVDGLTVTRLVREESGRDVRILMLTARGGLPDRLQGFVAGADDYLPKPFSPAELVARVNAILARSAPAPPAGGRLQHVDLVIDLDRHEVLRAGISIHLTRVEFKLLAALVSAKGRVLTRDTLLDSVYGHNADEIMERTLDVHIRRLRHKLGDDAEGPRYVSTVRGVGYRAAANP